MKTIIEIENEISQEDNGAEWQLLNSTPANSEQTVLTFSKSDEYDFIFMLATWSNNMIRNKINIGVESVSMVSPMSPRNIDIETHLFEINKILDFENEKDLKFIDLAYEDLKTKMKTRNVNYGKTK